jgi:hypothetical protein
MGVKISSLPVNTLPYTGAEQIPLVQGGETRAGTLSSLANYIVTDSGLAGLSGNWQNTYTTFNSNSANYAVKNANNIFNTNQDVVGDITATSFITNAGGGSTEPFKFQRFSDGSFGINNSDLPAIPIGDHIISLGFNAGDSAGGADGSVSDVVIIGQNAGQSAGAGNNNTEDIVAIGQNAGKAAGYFGTASNIVALGQQASESIGETGTANNVIAIGNQAGYLAGYNLGEVSDIIAIGREAGKQSGYETTSNNNIFIGLSSGFNKQGSRNTFIGDLTNTSPTSTLNLSGCIAIGYGATPTARNTIAVGSASTPLSVIPGQSLTNSLSGLKIMINGVYYTIPLLA